MVQSSAIRRINVGGKLLTNILKEMISYRQWNMMDEFYNINDAKEALCYLSTEFENELKYAREESRTGCRVFDREFVLPDYVQSFHGSVRLPLRLQTIINEEKKMATESLQIEAALKDESNVNNDSCCDTLLSSSVENKGGISQNSNPDKGSIEGIEDNDSEDETEEQTRQRIMAQREEEKRRKEMEEEEKQALLMSVERFTVPEILFRPSDIEMTQLGLCEAIVQSIEACDPIYRAAMYHNIVLTGGNMNIPNFKQRVEIELRSIAPIQYKIRIHLPKDPVTFAFEGAQDIIQSDGFVCGMDRAEWEISKQSGKASSAIWNSNNLPDGLIVI